MHDLRLDLTTCLLGIALASACGDDEASDTGNDTQSSESGTVTLGDSSSSGGSSSGTATITVGDTGSTTATETASTGPGESTDDTVTATTSATLDDSSSGSGSSSDDGSSSSSGGPACSQDMESCADGQKCCDTLMCCSGQPIPPGAEYCSDSLCPISDRNKKENFAAVDPHEVLAKVAALPITSWNYTFEDDRVRHIGPMAQDFQAAFGVGSTDKAIFQVDADGVVLASVQALHRELEAVQKENDDLRERLAKLERAVAARR